jgi:hypothetical protein
MVNALSSPCAVRPQATLHSIVSKNFSGTDSPMLKARPATDARMAVAGVDEAAETKHPTVQQLRSHRDTSAMAKLVNAGQAVPTLNRGCIDFHKAARTLDPAEPATAINGELHVVAGTRDGLNPSNDQWAPDAEELTSELREEAHSDIRRYHDTGYCADPREGQKMAASMQALLATKPGSEQRIAAANAHTVTLRKRATVDGRLTDWKVPHAP